MICPPPSQPTTDVTASMGYLQYLHDDIGYDFEGFIIAGSRATAVAVVPPSKRKAAHVSMLQRSPGYVVSMPSEDPLVNRLNRWLPQRLASVITIWKRVILGLLFDNESKRYPDFFRRLIVDGSAKALGPDSDTVRYCSPLFKPFSSSLLQHCKLWWAVALACTAAHVMCQPVGLAKAERPNIVVIVADDWGFTDLGAFGGEISTPNLDALALRGMRFSNFHVAASCSPTRSMLLTGVDNHRNGVGNLREAMPTEHLGHPGYQGSLNRNVVTVASLLQDGGYRTYITGKWNVGSEPYNLPNQRGFDKSIVQGDTGSDNWVPTQRYLPHAAQVDWFEDGKPATMPAEFYSSEYFVDRMLAYIESDPRKDKPFFAYLGFQANHVPVQAPRNLIDKYKGRYQTGWTALREARAAKAVALGLFTQVPAMVTMNTTTDWGALSQADRAHMEREMEVYAGMAEAMDFHVGRVVEALRKSGELDNTVFVFLSDNGPEGSDYAEAQAWLYTQYTQDTDRLGGKGAYGVVGPSWASASASPLSTYKFYAGEGGIRTPMFISGPRIAQGAPINHGLTHVTDIAPTLLDLAGVVPPMGQYQGHAVEPIAGRSLLPLLTGQAATVRGPNEPLGYELSGNLAVFKGTLKLTKNLPPLGDGQWHLYDLARDPGETRDLQSSLPDVFAALQADYAHYAQVHGVLPMPASYSPQRQVLINSFWHYWLPTYGGAAAACLVAVIGAMAGLVIWRRRDRRNTVKAAA